MCVHVLLVLIRRQCAYDGVSTYWYPSTDTIQAQCPNGTQTVSERVGMIANQVVKKKCPIKFLIVIVAWVTK